METVLIKPINRSQPWSRPFKLHMTIRGFPKKTLFRVSVVDVQGSVSLFNNEFDMGDSASFHLTVEVPCHIKGLLIRCRDVASTFQCWEREVPVKEALNKGVPIDMRNADFGKGLGHAMRKVF